MLFCRYVRRCGRGGFCVIMCRHFAAQFYVECFCIFIVDMAFGLFYSHVVFTAIWTFRARGPLCLMCPFEMVD